MRRRGPLAAFFALGVFWGGWAALVPAIQAAVGASKGELGLALLFVAVGSLPAMLAHRRPARPPRPAHPAGVLTGLAVAAVLPAFAESVAALAAALLVLGVATGAVDVAMNGAVAELEARRSTRLMQLAHGLFSAGVVAGAIGIGLAREGGASRLDVSRGRRRRRARGGGAQPRPRAGRSAAGGGRLAQAAAEPGSDPARDRLRRARS